VVLSKLDQKILARCLTGSNEGWEDFVARFLPLLVHVVNNSVVRRFGRLVEATRDDLVAEVLLTLVNDDFAILRRFRGHSSLGTYLVVIARRVAAHSLNKRRLGKTNGQTDSALASYSSDELRQLERLEEVQAMLGRLPDNEAQAIRMFHLEHCSYAEIGGHLGISENSVGPLLSRARSRLRALEQSDRTS
jgi:RNA polymerase sigma-70 factor (ECF subfamily)